MIQRRAESERDMEALGADLARALEPQAIVYLRGPLGAGKTTLVRGLLRALGHAGAVKSPTYTLVESYPMATLSLHHFDLYRLADPEELELIGLRDYLDEQSVCVVEWPERGNRALPPADLEITIQYDGTARETQWLAHSERGLRILRRLTV